jgi:hypothetical protein
MLAVKADAVVFEKHIYEQVGRADDTLRYCEDRMLWAAMVLKANWHMRPNLPAIIVFAGHLCGAISQTEGFTLSSRSKSCAGFGFPWA